MNNRRLPDPIRHSRNRTGSGRQTVAFGPVKQIAALVHTAARPWRAISLEPSSITHLSLVGRLRTTDKAMAREAIGGEWEITGDRRRKTPTGSTTTEAIHQAGVGSEWSSCFIRVVKDFLTTARRLHWWRVFHFRERAMDFPFGQLHREINGLMFERPSDVTIKVDSLDKFTAALSASVDIKPGEPKGVADATFCGVKVTASDLVPDGMAVIIHGGEIVNIIRYAA